MAEYERVLALADLPPGTGREVAAGGRPVALFNVGGRVHAISNVCLHRGGPLGQGMLDGGAVMCPWHAWSWDVATGENTANPELKVACFEVKVEGGEIYVKVG
ncbi:MAG TPA: Rieske 2Fe-2S domain-containing protein [Vicinamibacteria bacterium]